MLAIFGPCARAVLTGRLASAARASAFCAAALCGAASAVTAPGFAQSGGAGVVSPIPSPIPAGGGQTGAGPTAARPPAPALAAPAGPTPSGPTMGAGATPKPSAAAPSAPPLTVTPGAPSGAPAPASLDAPGASEANGTPLVDVVARPAAIVSGQVTWADGYPALLSAFGKISQALEANGLKAAGKPLAVLVATTDEGFSFEAMTALESAPIGKDRLTPDVRIGKTPEGKAYRFQHRSAYDDLDSTYEAITAFLDEKGIEAKDVIVEEYLTTPKDADDLSLEVDIYVFPKEGPKDAPTAVEPGKAGEAAGGATPPAAPPAPSPK